MNQPISSLFSLYVSRSNLAESSVAIKSRAVRSFIKLFGDMDVSTITYGHIEDWVAWLNHGRAVSTVYSFYLPNLKPFFKWLAKRGYVADNPAIGIRMLTIGETRRPSYTGEEIERMIRVADLRWKVIILLGLLSLRRAEILNLVVKDIYYDKNYILVSPKKNTDKTWQWHIKDHNQAITPLPQHLKLCDIEIDFHALLIELNEAVGNGQPYFCVKPVFYRKMMQLKLEGKLTWELRNCPYANFERVFRAILRRAKIEPKRFQDLRRTFANTMIRAGATIKETQRLMRHASAQTTMRYYLDVEDEKTVAKANQICTNYYGS